jgi:two-component system cell cycle response regulator
MGRLARLRLVRGMGWEQNRSMTPKIIERIRTADNLPSLPAVAVQVLKLTQADEVSISEIARVIQQDPALTARVLRIVNSSLFGMSRKVSSLQQAMVVLGLRTVKVMVLSFSLVDTMRSRTVGGFDFSGYWRRSLTTAVASKLIAEEVRRALVDEAFIGGLLCDLGMLAAVQCARELYMPILQRYDAGTEPVQMPRGHDASQPDRCAGR